MELPNHVPPNLALEDLSRLLFEVGAALSGKKLRRSSWREIATALRGAGSLAVIVEQRLRSARTRDDALRVLRIVRRAAASTRSSGRRTAARGRASKSAILEQVDVPVADERWDCHDPWVACCWGPECCGVIDADDRLAFAGQQLIDALSSRERPFAALAGLTPSAAAERATTRGRRVAAEPVESRLLNHSNDAIHRLEDQAFLAAIAAAVGDPRNLDVINAAAREHACPQLAARLCLFAPFWLREPRSWDGERRLVEHLFVSRSVPGALYDEWERSDARHKWLCWFVLLGHGASLQRAAKLFSWRVAKRFQQCLAGAPDVLTPLEATMFAEVIRLGGSEIEFRRLASHRAYVVDRTERSDQPAYDRFWEETVRWLAAQRDMLDDEGVELILDWGFHEHTEAPSGPRRFSWKGRSIPATLVRAREYRNFLDSLRPPFHGLRWNAHRWDYELDDWTFVELTSTAELVEEGYLLRHCVAGYAGRCATGYAAIVSLQRAGDRRVTIEINPATRALVQARGRSNRSCGADEQRVIQHWLTTVVQTPG